MACHRQVTIFLLTYFLLTSCLCSRPTRSRRQKRGLVKMMMHIMWDPVRLIRYWYAYDVTREIAKSWRKIIPTILLLPITQHMPQSYGLAKYVHPTVGIRDFNKSKKRLKYPSIPSASYQGSAGNVKPVAIPPALLHQVLPSRYSYAPPYNNHHTSSKETESIAQYNHKNVQHVVIGHVPFEDDKEDSNQYPIAHYFAADGTSREEVPTSNRVILFPEQVGNGGTDEDISSSSSQSVFSSSYKKRPSNFHSTNIEENHFHYVPHVGAHGAAIQDENGQEVSPVLHPGQEFRIVLHPIPISDFDPDSFKPPSDGRAVQFVPVQSQSNESYKNVGLSPILFKAVSQNSAESDGSHEERAVDPSLPADSNGTRFHLNSSEEEKGNGTSDVTKFRVTWVPQKNENLSRRTDQKERDLQAGSTMKRIVSVHSNTPQKYEFKKDGSNRFELKRHNINMDRLREDLKHGTPVLIPFSANTYSSDVTSTTNLKKTVIVPQAVDVHLDNDPRTSEQSSESKVVKVPIVSDSSGINSSSEHSGENNSTQRLVLFLKKRKNS